MSHVTPLMKEIRLNLFGYPDLSFFLINLLSDEFT